MNKERIELLSQDVWDMVWQMLDAEPDVPTIQVGIVAHITQKAFVEAFELVEKAKPYEKMVR